MSPLLFAGTSSIDPFVYAVFLKALLLKLVQTVEVDGHTVQVWKATSDITFDAEAYGNDDDDDGTSEPQHVHIDDQRQAKRGGEGKRKGKRYKAMAKTRVKKTYAANKLQARARGHGAKKLAKTSATAEARKKQ